MDRQNAFDTAVRGVIEQGGFARENRLGRYRTETGLKCAVGHLLPDDAGDAVMNHMGAVGSLVSSHREIYATLGISSNEDLLFLTDLQRAHDNAFDDLTYFRAAAEVVARRYNLNPAAARA